MGWTKKILRVNLTKGTCTAEPLMHRDAKSLYRARHDNNNPEQ